MKEKEQYSQKLLAECLSSFIKLLPTDKNANRFIKEIAQQTINKSNAGQHISITTKDLFLELFPKHDESQASSKLANIWKGVKDLEHEIKYYLTEHAVNEFGLDVYPWVEKIDSEGGAGNLVRYRLIGIKVDKAKVAAINPYRAKLAHDIEYTAIQDFQPSFFARLFFGKNNEIIGYKKWIMIFFPLAQIIFYFMMIVALVFFLQKETLTTISFYKLGLLVVAGWFLLDKVRRFERFSDDRILLASNYFMAWKEFSILQELVTVNDDKGNFLHKKIKLTKYVGICPICSAQVELSKGEPDYPRRIIGRCNESPREHIYSFDRITKLGRQIDLTRARS